MQNYAMLLAFPLGLHEEDVSSVPGCTEPQGAKQITAKCTEAYDYVNIKYNKSRNEKRVANAAVHLWSRT